jgi:predicted TIM-barrel fold metal-dependent hydrolase
MSPATQAIDCHAHIVDPGRFPFVDGPGYRPKPHETGTAEAYAETLSANGVSHALLVQPSGYGSDNSAMLDAMRRFPGRFRAIAVLDPAATSDRTMAELSEAGVVGVRFNLVSYDRGALRRPEAGRLLDRLADHGWYAQIYADDDQWPVLAELLRLHKAKVLIDHFGIRDISAGVDQPGFRAVLALGREGRAAVKLSGPFRISRTTAPYADLEPFAEALLAAFGLERCVWGSDWPFLDCAAPVEYAQALAALDRWLPDADDRRQVLWRTPAALFGFGEAA